MDNVFKSVADFRLWRNGLDSDLSLGFVPTMGGLHEGHFSLIRRSLEVDDKTVVSIFLNRTQFNNQSDYETYPASFAEDVDSLNKLGVAVIFAPNYQEMYPDSYRYRVTESELSLALEGEHRPGHFDGVLTIVMRLLNVVNPVRAYFGEKDYQQLELVKGMVDGFFMPIDIVACPTARSESGLALSSRNRRLSDAGLLKAARFNQILSTAEDSTTAIQSLSCEGFTVEYVEDKGTRRLGAVMLEGVRLIDNVEVSQSCSQNFELKGSVGE